jgi:hypothetical protein
MIIKELYIDLDGCLCNFEKRFRELFHEPPQVNYPLSNTAKNKKFKQEFITFIDGKNFATLEPMPDFYQAALFLNKISKKFPIYILSSTARPEYDKEIAAQKTQWLKTYDIHFPTIFVPGKVLKQNYSGKGNVLIDDTLSNVIQWNNRGGIGIRHINWKNTIKQFNDLLE